MDRAQRLKRERRRYRAEWLLFALVVFSLVAARGYALFRTHTDIEQQESGRLQVQARVISANLLQQIAGVDKALAGVRDDYFSGVGVPGMQAMTGRRLKALTAALPGVRAMLVLDAQGQVVAANHDEWIGRSFPEREYFATPRAQPQRELLYVSRPFKSESGVWITNLSRVLVDASGRFAGIVTAALDPDYFNVVLNSVLYAPDMRTTLVHDDGTVFLNAPPNPKPLGTHVNVPGSFFARHRDSGRIDTLLTGTVMATGEERMVATRTLVQPSLAMDHPMVLHVSRQIDAIYAAWVNQATWLATILAAVAVLCGAALAFIQRRRKEYEILAASVQREREEGARRISTITDNLPILISYIDSNERVQFLNGTFSQWLGLDLAASIGRPLADVINPPHYAKQADALRRALAGERMEFEVRSVALGVERDLRNIYVPDLDRDGKVAGIYTLSTDVTALKHVERQLSALARTDSLTGLANRHQFDEKLLEALARAARTGKAMALMFLDIDLFKTINDSLGHAAGDEVLKEFARRLKLAVRTTDSIARLAGDEFVIILEGLNDRAEPQAIARKILSQISRPFDIGGREQQVSTSLGIAFHKDGAITPSELLAQADHALYEAKAAGRNTYRMAGQAMAAAG
jgi:diguanylate cyclase (GGDEF)-like protein/PAS domain S-box-containing protein